MSAATRAASIRFWWTSATAPHEVHIAALQIAASVPARSTKRKRRLILCYRENVKAHSFCSGTRIDLTKQPKDIELSDVLDDLALFDAIDMHDSR